MVRPQRIHDVSVVFEPHAVAGFQHHRLAPEFVRAEVHRGHPLGKRVLHGEPGIRGHGHLPGVDGSHQRLEPRKPRGVAEIGVSNRVARCVHVSQGLRLVLAQRRLFLAADEAEGGEHAAADAGARRDRPRAAAAAAARGRVRRAVVARGGRFNPAETQTPRAVVQLAVAGAVTFEVRSSRVVDRGWSERRRRGRVRHAHPEVTFIRDALLVVVVHVPAHVAQVITVVFVQRDDHARHGGTPGE